MPTINATKYSEERMFPEEPKDMPLEFVYLWLKQYEEHIARYRFFGEYARNKCVLDAGCGFGYGSATLAIHGAKKIIGIDKSNQTLRYAAKKYDSNNLYYIAADVTCTPFEEKTFDAIYAFELIEHIQNDYVFLSEMARLLKDDGYIFISTPNKKLSGFEDGSKKNQYHIREYDLDEFRNLLNNHFNHVKIYGEGYSQRYRITDHNLNSIRLMRGRIIQLEQQIIHLENQINYLNNKFNRLHIELAKKIFPKRLQDSIHYLLKKYKPDYGILKYKNDVSNVHEISPLISVAPSAHEIIINLENLEDALYFVGVCKK